MSFGGEGSVVFLFFLAGRGGVIIGQSSKWHSIKKYYFELRNFCFFLKNNTMTKAWSIAFFSFLCFFSFSFLFIKTLLINLQWYFKTWNMVLKLYTTMIYLIIFPFYSLYFHINFVLFFSKFLHIFFFHFSYYLLISLT